MKQVVQSYKTGQVSLREVPVPQCGSKRILVRNKNSLISLGTERSTIELGQKSLFGKAAARPDLVRRAWDKAKKEGLLKTWQEAMGRLDTPTPLGYSCAGVVQECGAAATEFSPGERVACVGQGFASHAEFVSIPINLACRIPDSVSDEEASFSMLGIIALHGIRSANLTFGSKVVVLGLGLLGLLTIQILRAYGCDVIAIDPSQDKVEKAKKLGFRHLTSDPQNLNTLVEFQTGNYGADAVIITASSKDRGPVDQAISLCRRKGRIVVVGTADIHPDRNEMWHKEIELIVSKAAGPGSLDPIYEIEGVDLPIEDVRWTQKRNLQEFLRLVSEGKVDTKSLITHRIDITSVEGIYAQVSSGELLNPIGIVIDYPSVASLDRVVSVARHNVPQVNASKQTNLGVIGAGLFGKALLLPSLKNNPAVCLHTLVTSSGVSAQHSAQKFGFLNHATDSSMIWGNPDIHAVVGLTPHSHHAQLVQSAIENNKSLFIEKPLCTTKEELDELQALINQQVSLPIIFVGHNRRYSPHTAQMQKWLESRQGPCVVNIRVNAGFIPKTHWVHSEEEGRSRIVGEMSHFIDLIQALTHATIVRVSAERISSNNQNTINNDNIAIAFKLSDGSVGSLVYSASGDKAYSREALEIFFDGKTIHSHDFRQTELWHNGKISKFKTSSQEIGYVQELRHFTDCIRGLALPLVSTPESISTMRVIFAIEQALASAQSIALQ